MEQHWVVMWKAWNFVFSENVLLLFSISIIKCRLNRRDVLLDGANTGERNARKTAKTHTTAAAHPRVELTHAFISCNEKCRHTLNNIDRTATIPTDF